MNLKDLAALSLAAAAVVISLTFSTNVGSGSDAYGYVSQAEKRRQGISDGLIRIAVGLEDVEDVIADLRLLSR